MLRQSIQRFRRITSSSSPSFARAYSTQQQQEGAKVFTGTVAKATICGRVGRDPEVKSIVNGGNIVIMNLATNDYRNKEKFTTWHKVITYNERVVEKILKSVKKGSLVYVQGDLRVYEYAKSPEQPTKTVVEVVVNSTSDFNVLHSVNTPNPQNETESEESLVDHQ